MGIFAEILNKTGSLFALKKTGKEREREIKRTWYHKNKKKNKDHQLKYKFGITLQDFDRMVESQGNLCAICGGENVQIRGRTVALAVDHNHKTGKVRGLLCNGCNTSLGRFKDIPMLKKAIKYLEETDGNIQTTT
jgi:hypothetical protein